MKRAGFFFVVAPLLLSGLLSAAEPVVLFEDTFDQKPGEGWSWLREEAGHWRIQDGALEIRVQPGKANNVKNALVRKAPDRSNTKFAVEVTVTFTTSPTTQYEQGGITWYHDAKPVFKLVHENVNGQVVVVPGLVPAPSKTVQLRLVVDNRNWTAQYRENPEDEFSTTATGMLPPPGNDQISLQCYDGPTDAAHWIRFDDFRIIQLPE